MRYETAKPAPRDKSRGYAAKAATLARRNARRAKCARVHLFFIREEER